MTEYNSDGIPIRRLSKEESEYYEQEEERLNALLRKKKTKRTQPFKDLMRDRTTVQQALTLWEIFSHVFPDAIEEYHKEYGSDPSSLKEFEPRYNMYIRRLIKHVRKTNDDFRWLSCVPCKDERGKIKAYKYVNIKARESDGSDSRFLEEVNAFWHKHALGSIAGLERVHKRLQMLSQMTEEQHERSMDLMKAYWKYEEYVSTCCDNKDTVDDMITSLRSEGRLEKLPVKHIPNYDRIYKAVKQELCNTPIQLNNGWLTSEGKPPEESEIFQIVKDTIATYCNRRRYVTKERTSRQSRLEETMIEDQ
jgi:hypothetical protein